MSIKTILVHADDGRACDRRVRLAAQVADMFGAALTGLAAENFDEALATAYATDGMIVEALQKRTRDDLHAAEAHFRALVSERPCTAWAAVQDFPDKALSLRARGADLIVASRFGRGDRPAFAARAADVVLEAGVPVLLAADGEEAFSGEHVVIAWKDTREARRAVTDALPFLKRARRATIVAAEAGEASFFELVRRLERHGVAAQVETIKPSHGRVAAALEDAATRLGADLIVAGAYGHTRFGEWMLGGVTEDFLTGCSKFLLLSH